MAMFVGLIMLLIITILGLATYNAAKGSLQIVGNFQHRNEAKAAAQEAIEEAVSTLRLYQQPADVIRSPCSAKTKTRCVDVDGDGKDDVKVTLAVSCIKRAPVRVTSLNFESTEDRKCAYAPPADFGVENANPVVGCIETLWDVGAQATDDVTGASVAVAQGAGVRMSMEDASKYCP